MDDFLFNLIFQHLMWIPWVRPRETELQAWYRHSDICLRKTQLPKNWSQGLTNFQSHYFLRNCFAHSWFGPLLANQTIADWYCNGKTWRFGASVDGLNDQVKWFRSLGKREHRQNVDIRHETHSMPIDLFDTAKQNHSSLPCSFDEHINQQIIRIEPLRSCHDRMSW